MIRAAASRLLAVAPDNFTKDKASSRAVRLPADMPITIPAVAPEVVSPAPLGCEIRFLIAEPDQNFRDSVALIMGAMHGGHVVCRASNATETGQWLLMNPLGWDVALVDADIAADPASRLRFCGRDALTQQAVIVLCHVASSLDQFGGEATLACYDKRRDMDRLVGLCMQLRCDRNAPMLRSAPHGRGDS